MSIVVLGDIEFEGFEVPAQITFGGGQQLATHKLIGGTRIIDSLGRDDAALSWAGVLSGSAASERARSLDAIRSAGLLQTLTWNAFSFAVIVEKLKLQFCNPWWIPYSITCAVQRDLAQGALPYVPSITSSIVDDLTSAAAYLNPLNVLLSVDLQSTTPTTAIGRQQLMQAVILEQATVNQGIQNASVDLGTNGVAQTISAAGALAQLCYARGFLGRSISNIENYGS